MSIISQGSFMSLGVKRENNEADLFNSYNS